MRCARLHAAALALALGLVLARPTDVRADDGPTTAAPNYLRAVLEEGAIMAVGVIQYQSAASSNAVDWDLGYNWPSFRGKLTGQNVRFDTNHFDTNMVTHPIAGTLYYVAARGNRLTALESLLFATAASTLWEYVGEFREMVSINDLIVTPLSGMVVGETLTRLGVFLHRGRSSVVTRVLGTMLAPSTSVHEWLDGTPIPRDIDVDALGLTRAIGHRIDLLHGVCVVEVSDKSQRVDARFALGAEVVDVEHVNAPGRLATGFFDTGVSRLHAEGAVGTEGLRDLQLDVLVAPVGYYVHDLRRQAHELLGERFYVGATVGFDYAIHAYRPLVGTIDGDSDQLAGVHAAGVTAAYANKGRTFSMRTMLDAHPEFALVRSVALPDYQARGGALARLPSVTRGTGYYYAVGVVVAPTVEVGAYAWTLGAQARLESYWGIEGLDRHQEGIRDQVSTQDRRTIGRLYASYSPTEALSTRLMVERRGREGEVADVAAKRAEWALTTSVGVEF